MLGLHRVDVGRRVDRVKSSPQDALIAGIGAPSNEKLQKAPLHHVAASTLAGNAGSLLYPARQT
jgi:hypothetical protein